MRPIQVVVGLLSAGLCVWKPAHAQPFVFTRIAGSGDTMPGSIGGVKFRDFDLPSISDGRITYAGLAGTFAGLYEWQNGTNSKIADASTSIPGASGTFTQLGNDDNDGEHVLFHGAKIHNNENDVGGLYWRKDAQLARVVDTTMTAPNGGVFEGFAQSRIETETIAFRGHRRVGQALERAVYKWQAGTLSTVADTNTPVPGGTGNFSNNTGLFRSVHLDRGAVYGN